MTGTTTQMMIDLADIIRGDAPEIQAPKRARLRRMSASVAAFAFGCASAALLFAQVAVWCFVVPPLIGLAALTPRMAAFKGDVE